MTLSNLTAYQSIPDNSAATPGLFDTRFNVVHQNLSQLNTTISTISGGVLTSYANATARDVAIPSPAANQIAAQQDTGYFYRRDQATSTWRPEGLTRAAGAVITSNSKNIVGDGVNDDSVQLALADVAAVASGGRHELDLSALPTRCYVNSNLTLNAPFRPNPGAAKIYVGTGKTLTIAGGFDPGLYQVFDPAMPGSVVFSTKGIAEFRPQWFGALGLGSVQDDAPGWRFAIASVPDSSMFRLSPFFVSFFRSTVVVSLRNNLSWIADHKLDADGKGGSAKFVWDGKPGGRALVFDRCQHPRFTGIYFQHLTDDTTFAGLAGRMSLNGTHLFDDALTGNFNFVSPGQMVQVSGAGGVAGSGDPLITTVASRVSDHELIVNAPATTAVSLAEWCIGSANGLPAKTMLDFDGEAGTGVLNGLAMYSVVSGSNRIMLNDGNVFPDMFDGVRQITLDGAGPAGANLVTTLPVGGYISDTRFTVTANASTTVTNGSFAIVAPAAGNGEGTAGHFSECRFLCPVGGTVHGLESVRIGRLSQTNNEFFTFERCSGVNQGSKRPGALASVSGTALAFVADYFTGQLSLGMRVRIGNAGAGGNTVHDTHITAIADTKNATLAVAAPTAQASTWTMVGEGIGRMIYIGMNNNSLDHIFRECDFNGFQDGVVSGGSYKAYECNSSFCENRFHIIQSSRSCLHVNDIGEADGCIVKLDGGGVPLVLVTGDYDVQGIVPNGGAFDLSGASNATITFIGGNIEATPRPSTTVIKFGSNQVKMDGVTFPAGCSLSELGLATITAATSFDSDNHFGLYLDDAHTILAPGRLVIGRNQTLSQYPTGGDTRVNTSLLMLTGGYNGTAATQEPTAARAELDSSTNVTYNGGVLSAHAAVLFPTGGNSITGTSDIYAYRVGWGKRGVGINAGLDNHRVHGICVESPKYTGGTLGDLYGARVQDLRALVAGGSITRSHGFYSEGALDDNWFAGPSKFGVIGNAQILGIQVYASTLTPTSVASATIAEQTFTVTGLTTADKVMVNPPAIANSTGIAGARVSGADTLAIRFANPTAGALTPSSGTYLIIAVRS